jgi:Ca2+-binding EF-hand superfamily protein
MMMMIIITPHFYAILPLTRVAIGAYFQVQVLLVADNALTPASVSTFREVFALFDTNKDSAVDIDELHTGMNQAKAISVAELQELVDTVDEERTGDLNFANFCELMLIMGDRNKESAGGEEHMVKNLDGTMKLVV